MSFHVQVVPSGARTVNVDPLTDSTVPRSNATVFEPALLGKVTWPCSPPMAAIRRSGLPHRARRRLTSAGWLRTTLGSLRSLCTSLAHWLAAVAFAGVALVAAAAPPVRAMPMAAPLPIRIALAATEVTTRLVRPHFQPDRVAGTGALTGSAGSECR